MNSGLVQLAINFVSSVTIVFCNKIIFSWYKMPYGAALSTFHFAVTALGLIICSSLGILEYKKLPWVPLLRSAFVYAISVPFCNLSIKWNSLSFYQISKVTIIPTTIMLDFFFYGGKLELEMLYYIIPIASGAFLTGKTDIQTTALGVFMAVSCVLTSSLAQQWVKVQQAQYGITSMQMMIYVIPISVVVQGIFIPAFDRDITEFAQFEWTTPLLLLIAFSGVLAFVVNLTIFTSLRGITPVTYQVVGQAKSVTILVGSFLVFGQVLDMRNVFGMCVTMTGVFYYTYLKTRQSTSIPANPTSPDKNNEK